MIQIHVRIGGQTHMTGLCCLHAMFVRLSSIAYASAVYRFFVADWRHIKNHTWWWIPNNSSSMIIMLATFCINYLHISPYNVNNHQRQMLCGSICPSIPRFGEKNHCIFGTAKKKPCVDGKTRTFNTRETRCSTNLAIALRFNLFSLW